MCGAALEEESRDGRVAAPDRLEEHACELVALLDEGHGSVEEHARGGVPVVAAGGVQEAVEWNGGAVGDGAGHGVRVVAARGPREDGVSMREEGGVEVRREDVVQTVVGGGEGE